MKTHTLPAVARRRRSALALVFVLAPTLVPVSAFAQDEASTKAARARFQEGVQYYDKGQYESARAAFLQAYALRKHPAVLLNLAQSDLKSGHTMEAIKYFQQYLREATQATPAQRSDAEKGLAEARTKIGRLEISAPTGSEITVDGAVVGTAPLADPIDVEPGTHMIRAKMSDGTTDTKSATPSAGDKLRILFSSTEKPAAPPPVLAPPPTETTPPPSSSTPPELDKPPSEPIANANTETTEPPPTGSSRWTLVPGFIGLGVAVAGGATAIVFAIAKSKAQDSANTNASQITSQGGGKGTCTSTDAATQAQFGAACAQLRDNNDKVNSDATVANIGLGVGIAGAVLGTTWLIVAGVHNSKAATADKPPTTSWIRPVPIFGRDTKGLGLEGRF